MIHFRLWGKLDNHAYGLIKEEGEWLITDDTIYEDPSLIDGKVLETIKSAIFYGYEIVDRVTAPENEIKGFNKIKVRQVY